MSFSEPIAVPALQRWWGDYDLEVGQGGSFRVGPLALAVRREPREWRFAWRRDGDLQTAEAEVLCPRPGAEVEERGELVRVVSGAASSRLALMPRLADRPVVARPESTFRLRSGATVDLYVSTPVWIRAEVGEPPEEALDVPSWRITDTWRGSFTGGELGYAVKTSARLHLENLPVLPHRAVTLVRLVHRGEEPLAVERLILPVPYLSLYADPDHNLWTQVVQIESGSDGDLAEVDLGKGPPSQVRTPELVAGPRQALHRNILFRALDLLF